MNVEYIYDRVKDIECLLRKSKNSYSAQPTKVQEQLFALKGEDPSESDTDEFVAKYLSDNSIDTGVWISKFREEWADVAEEYQKRAEAIFGVALPENVTGFLTINQRCPYSIKSNYFYISIPNSAPNRIPLHELWHFYTWYGLGVDQEEKLGKQKYNDLKEALTVLLNVECKDLLPDGVTDNGYPQHQELRQKILEYWEKDRNIKNLWNYLIT